MSPAISSNVIGPSTSGVLPWARCSGVKTLNCSAKAGRFGPHARASTPAPPGCKSTRGSPFPSWSYHIQIPPTSTYSDMLTFRSDRSLLQTQRVRRTHRDTRRRMCRARGDRTKLPAERASKLTVRRVLGYRRRNSRSSARVPSGFSSGKKCPPGSRSPSTWVAQARQMPSGPPSSSYQASSGPEVAESTRVGALICRPAARS